MVCCWSSECQATVVVALVETEQEVVAVVQVFGPLEMIHSPKVAAAEVVRLISPLVVQQPR